MEDKTEELLHTNNQELWYTIKRTSLRIHRIEERAEVQTKGIRNIFNELIAKNVPNLYNNIYTNLQEP
jgi:hypothetical protein